MTPLDHALERAARGWAVFPVGNDKAPRCPRGHKAASTDPATIRAMHARFGFVLVGVATGEASNIAVLDIDKQHGGEAWLERHRDSLPPSFNYETRSGGRHFWFRHRPGLRCSTARIAPGIDVKAEGGAAIFWPAAGFPVLSDAPLAAWPEWLAPPARTVSAPAWQPPRIEGTDQSRRYALAALRRAVERVAGTAEGGRNARLNAETFSMARFITTGALSPGELAEAMAHAGIAAGLDRREVEATLASALRRAA